MLCAEHFLCVIGKKFMSARCSKVARAAAEFPNTTIAFFARDIVALLPLGHEVKNAHLTSYKRNEIIHCFARPAPTWAKDFLYLFSLSVARSALHHIGYRPSEVLRNFKEIINGDATGRSSSQGH